MGAVATFELRALAAKRPEVVSAIDRILFREIERLLQRASGPPGGRAGAITFVQRFGGSLNLHVHFHVLFLEGLFTRDGEAPPVFHEALTPTRTELLAVLARVHRAVLHWLARRGLDRRPDHDGAADTTDPDALDALDACAHAAVQTGLFDKIDGQVPGRGADADRDEPTGAGRHSVALDGFNLHAAVAVGGDDDVSRERLVRYCARPPFALERLSMLPDGRIAYRIKQPRRNATHRILEPIELLARIAALIPPPRHPFLRYHGVLAPSAKWRRHIVPRPECAEPAPTHATTAAFAPASAREQVHDAHGAHAPRTSASIERSAPRSSHAPTPSQAAARVRDSLLSSASSAPGHRSECARITAAHRARLEGGDVLARTPRLDWAKLLRRTFACEVLVCPRCTGRARIIAAIHDPSEARRFLMAIDQRSVAPPLPHARPVSDDDASHIHRADSDDSDADEISTDDECELAPPSSRPEAPQPDD